jgi:hypothetical protein
LKFDATREKTRLWLLLLIGVVATLLGQTHARQIFAPSPHGSGIFATQTQASTGEIYDVCRYDAPDSLLAANKAGAAERGGLNLFRAGPDGLATREAATGWKEGDRMLKLYNQGSPQANWAQNAGRLRQEMGAGNPIFDSYRDAATGLQIQAGVTPTSGGRFSNAERKLLESRGWQYSPSSGAYHPPTP